MTARSPSPDLEWCHEAVQGVSRTFALTVDVLEEPMSSEICLGYLLCRVADTVEDAGHVPAEEQSSLLRTYRRTLDPDERTDDDVQIAHFDVNDATGKYTDRMNAFDSFIHIEQGYAELMQYFRRAHEGLAFFVGGDNVIAVAPDLDAPAYEDAIQHVRDTAEVELKVGVGQAANAQTAGMAAKHALEDCRDDGDRVVID